MNPFVLAMALSSAADLPPEKPAQKPTSVAVVALRADDALGGPAKALTTIVATEIGAMPGYKALAPNELRSMLDNNAMQQLMGCEDAACVADFSSLLATDRIVIGSLEAAGATEAGAVVLSLTLIDPSVPTVLARRTEAWRGPLDDIVSLPRPMLQQLLGGSDIAARRGALEVFVVDGTSVVVDGKVAGTTPMPRLPLTIGAHDVVVQRAGFVTQRRTVAIAADETNVVQLELVDEQSLVPWFQRPYVWGPVVGGVVLVGAATAGFVAYNVLADVPTTVTFKD